MADETKPKKEKAPKPEAPAAEAKPKKEKAPKDKDAAPAEAAGKKAKAPEPPRPPADPRMKYMKRFRGRLLPKGPLRERHKQLIARWQAGDDHGGVTVEELKSLYDDWMTSRRKPEKAGA
jgi:hypothetical protein